MYLLNCHLKPFSRAYIQAMWRCPKSWRAMSKSPGRVWWLKWSMATMSISPAATAPPLQRCTARRPEYTRTLESRWTCLTDTLRLVHGHGHGLVWAGMSGSCSTHESHHNHRRCDSTPTLISVSVCPCRSVSTHLCVSGLCISICTARQYHVVTCPWAMWTAPVKYTPLRVMWQCKSTSCTRNHSTLSRRCRGVYQLCSILRCCPSVCFKCGNTWA